MAKENEILTKAFLLLCANSHFHGKWVCSNKWVDLLQRYSELPSEYLLKLDSKKLNNITGRSTTLFSTDLFTPNCAGVYQVKFQQKVYDNSTGKSKSTSIHRSFSLHHDHYHTVSFSQQHAFSLLTETVG